MKIEIDVNTSDEQDIRVAYDLLWHAQKTLQKYCKPIHRNGNDD